VLQSWARLEVGVFQGKGSEFASEDENDFSDSPDGTPVTLEDGRLRVHFVSKQTQDRGLKDERVSIQAEPWPATGVPRFETFTANASRAVPNHRQDWLGKNLEHP
jgi:hypothetical protein